MLRISREGVLPQIVLPLLPRLFRSFLFNMSYSLIARPTFEPGTHYNREIERPILGICFFEPVQIPLVVTKLKKEYFYDTGHQIVFQALQEMYNSRIPIDMITIVQYLWDKGVKEINGSNTPYFISRLTNDVVSGLHTRYHCAVLCQLHERREALAAGKPLLRKSAAWKFPPHARWYLSMISKEALRYTAKKYGKSIIIGKSISPKIIQVPNENWVYLLHLIHPNDTFTCQSGLTTHILTRHQCQALLPSFKKLYLEPGNQLVWR